MGHKAHPEKRKAPRGALEVKLSGSAETFSLPEAALPETRSGRPSKPSGFRPFPTAEARGGAHSTQTGQAVELKIWLPTRQSLPVPV